MKNMITRTVLVASFMLAAVSLSACGSTDNCPDAIADNDMVTTAMLPAKGGHGHGHGHSSSHSSSHGSGESHSGGFRMPYWFGSSHNECKSDTTPNAKP